MMRKSFASGAGVILDRCQAHGVWLDRGELERVLSFVESGGMQTARLRELERLVAKERQLRERLDSVSALTMESPNSSESHLMRALMFLGKAVPPL